jgi:hypothetical protein
VTPLQLLRTGISDHMNSGVRSRLSEVAMPNQLLYAIGLASGLGNALYQRIVSFAPTDYSPNNIERGVTHTLEICDRWEEAIAACLPGESLVGKRILELGPGQSLGTGMVLLGRGALEYTGADLLPLAHRSPPALYAAIAAATSAPTSLIQQVKFQLVRYPGLEPLQGPFDVAVSNSTLEHVEDVPATFRALRRLVRGFMVHHIDATVHLKIRSVDPLNHLRFGDTLTRLTHYTGLPNRLRVNDYKDAARAAGFSEVHVVPTSTASAEYLARVRPHLTRRYRERDDLHYLTFILVAR